MRKSEPVRLYNFSDANLIGIGREKVAYMQRDAASFSSFGITSALVSALGDAITAFSGTVTDIEALGDQTGLTAAKNEKADALRVSIRNVMARVELRYSTKSSKYGKFGADTLSLQSDIELLMTGRRVVRVGMSLLEELMANGLTEEMLSQITALTNELETLIIDMQMSAGDRDIMQEDRVEAGNAVYSTLVAYAGIGRAIWETSDVAKYNDYVIYNTVSGAPPEATAV